MQISTGFVFRCRSRRGHFIITKKIHTAHYLFIVYFYIDRPIDRVSIDTILKFMAMDYCAPYVAEYGVNISGSVIISRAMANDPFGTSTRTKSNLQGRPDTSAFNCCS